MDWLSVSRSIQTEKVDSLWLICHASYIIRTANTLWAVDPVLQADVHKVADDTLYDTLSGLSFVLITHLHPDHFDPVLMEKLKGSSILWVLPDFMPEDIRKRILPLLGRYRFVHADEKLQLGDATITVFESCHSDVFEGKLYEVPEYGYRVHIGGRSFLFPVDVRNYTPQGNHAPVDELFLHVWLGRKKALNPEIEMINNCARYFLHFKPQRVWLSHLYDYTRTAESMWTNTHATMLSEVMHASAPEVSICVPEHGVHIPL